MKIIDQIYLQNPWFREKNFIFIEEKLPPREIFDSFYQDIINTKQIISLTGLRRTGKTTLIRQAINKLIQNGIYPKNILYFSFDQPTILEETSTLEEVINSYLTQIKKIRPYQIKEKIYLFFDEIQLIPFWQDIIKRYYDLNQHLKFIVSGSSSLYLINKAEESLAGRIFEKNLLPLSFLEYKKIAKEEDFLNYIDFGQFPELLEIKNKEKQKEYLKDGIINKVLEIDIIKNYKVRKTIDFERLFWSLLPNSGQIIKSAKLQLDLNLKKATLFNYLKILEKTLLVNKVLNLSGSFRSEARLLRKIYPASTNFLTLIPEPINIGYKIENYVFNVLKNKYKNIYFYRLRDKEIDFLIPEKNIALEVKYQEKIHHSEIWFLKKLIKQRGYFGVVITKNLEEINKKENLIFLPVEKIEEKFDLFN